MRIKFFQVAYFEYKNCNCFYPGVRGKQEIYLEFFYIVKKKYDITPIVRKWLKFYIGFLGLGQKCEEPIIISRDILEPFFGVYNFLFLQKKRHEDDILGKSS